MLYLCRMIWMLTSLAKPLEVAFRDDALPVTYEKTRRGRHDAYTTHLKYKFTYVCSSQNTSVHRLT